MLPDTEFYRNQRENDPEQYALSLQRHDARVAESHVYFKGLLERRGIPYIELEGMYQGEPDGVSYMVIADEATVMQFGKLFNQDSVLTRDGLIFTTRAVADVAATGEVMVGEEATAEDFYSVTPDGTAFSMGLDFEHTGPGVAVIPEGYTTRADRPQLPINGAGMVELHHWTRADVDTVDPAFAGTGPLNGAERKLAVNTSFFGINPRAALRDPGTGYVKEGGLGPKEYIAEVDPDRLYPWFEDPDNLIAGLTTSEARIAIKEAGYLGYYTTDDGSDAAPLGNVAALFEAVPVVAADTLLMQDADQGPRGQIALPPSLADGQAVITLFQSADASTFMHESGHFFLELFKTLATDANAPSTMTDDFSKVNEWLGRAADDTSEFTTEQQEKWAEGFETYLMEGNAPSIALRRAFQRFKDWLTHLYRTYSGPENQLTPEIRDVMDRMLATEEEIQLAKAEEGVGPMFLEHPPGMSEQSYEAYRRLMIDVDDEAEQKLFRKAMASIEKRNTKAYAEGVAAATEMHLAKLAEKKAYQLITRLQDPDVGIRLNKAELLARYADEDAADVLADFSRKKHGGSRNLYAVDGAPLDMVAEMAGYSSPGHMLRVLRTTPNMQQAAEKAAKAEVDRKFPDLLEDGTMREEARAALQNTKKGQLLHMEERQIRATIEAQGGQTPAPMSMDLMRATARDMIQSMTVGQASKPELFLRAERKAGREAQQAFARVASAAQGSRLSTTAAQDLMAAHAAKRRQILNYLLYTEAKKVADMVGKLQRKARQLNRKGARKKIGDPYISQIDRLLEQYDFRKLGPKAVRQKHALAALIQQLEENGHADRIAIRESMIAKTKAQHFSTLTTRELTDLRDTLKNLEHLGREVITGLLGAQELTFGEIKLELLESIEMHMDDNPPPLLPREESKSRRWASQIMNTLSTADTLIAQMDGNTGELGAAWRALKAPISAAQARVHARQTEARKAVAELFEKHFGKDLSILGSKTEYIAELNHDFTKAELLSMALNTGNADNWSRMTTGDLALGAPEDVRAALENHLSKEDWMFVQDFWDYINSYWGDIVALEMKTTGVAPQKVEADPKVVPYPFVKGGYYPIRYDARLSANVSEYQIDDTLKMLQVGRMTKAQTRDGHTKERMDRQMNKALVYDLGVGMAHLNDVIVDLELREPVKQVWRLLNDKDVQDTLRLKGADDARIWLKLWVGDVVNGDRWASGGFNTMLRHLRGGLSIAKMGFSLTTLIQQPLGLAQSMVVVGKQDMMRAIWKWKTNPMRYAEQVKELSPFMQERTETFQRDMMLIKGALDTSPVASKWNGFKRTMTTAAFWAIQKSQFHLVDVPTWMAVYDRELAKGTSAKDASLMADQFVARAQGSGLLSDRSGFERGTLAEDQRSNELARLATAFGSYMMAKMNVATQRVRGTDFTDPADMLSLFTDLILLYGVEAMGSIFLTGRWPDFEEEEKDPMWWLAGETLSAVASGFPVARDVASAIQGYGGGGAYGSVVEAPRDVWEGASTAVGVAIGVEDEERMRRALQSLAGGVGVLAQLPTIQLERAMTALFERDMTVRKDFNMLDLAFGRKD